MRRVAVVDHRPLHRTSGSRAVHARSLPCSNQVLALQPSHRHRSSPRVFQQLTHRPASGIRPQHHRQVFCPRSHRSQPPNPQRLPEPLRANKPHSHAQPLHPTGDRTATTTGLLLTTRQQETSGPGSLPSPEEYIHLADRKGEVRRHLAAAGGRSAAGGCAGQARSVTGMTSAKDRVSTRSALSVARIGSSAPNISIFTLWMA